MPELLILRHAKSSWKFPDLADHDRTLNKRGRRDAPRIGSLMKEEGLIPDGTAGIAGDLPSLVTGLAEGRTSQEQLTLFKTVGTALSDVACLVAIADAAEARDIGTLIAG